MMIYVYTPDGTEKTGIIDQYASAIWTVQFYGLGDFELITYPKYLDLIYPGVLLKKENNDNVMLVEKVAVKYDVENGNRVTVTGKSLKAILCKRIVWSQMNLSGTVEDAIRQVITENAISPSDSARELPIRLETAHGYTETIEAQLFGDNVGEWIASVCNQYGYGWDVVLDDGMVFKLYKGTDRTYTSGEPVVFSPKYGNIYTANYQISSDYTAALVGGEGDGTSKRTVSFGTASGVERVEAYIDGSSVSSNGEIITLETYLELLKSYGEEQIAQLPSSTSCECEIDAHGAFKLGVDYFLGDRIQIDLSSVYAVARITEIIYSEDEGGERVLPTFSEWEV